MQEGEGTTEMARRNKWTRANERIVLEMDLIRMHGL